MTARSIHPRKLSLQLEHHAAWQLNCTMTFPPAAAHSRRTGNASPRAVQLLHILCTETKCQGCAPACNACNHQQPLGARRALPVGPALTCQLVGAYGARCSIPSKVVPATPLPVMSGTTVMQYRPRGGTPPAPPGGFKEAMQTVLLRQSPGGVESHSS